jgi:hypothetical protein
VSLDAEEQRPLLTDGTCVLTEFTTEGPISIPSNLFDAGRRIVQHSGKIAAWQEPTINASVVSQDPDFLFMYVNGDNPIGPVLVMSLELFNEPPKVQYFVGSLSTGLMAFVHVAVSVLVMVFVFAPVVAGIRDERALFVQACSLVPRPILRRLMRQGDFDSGTRLPYGLRCADVCCFAQQLCGNLPPRRRPKRRSLRRNPTLKLPTSAATTKILSGPGSVRPLGPCLVGVAF